jgi:hypothetical protein
MEYGGDSGIECPALGIFSAVVTRDGLSFTLILGLKAEIGYR